jgi:Peptidase family C25
MKTFFTILVLLVSLGLSAQPYNNEWINFSNTYYKFKVGADGLYRIPQSVLAANGLGGVPVQNYQLFRNGQEVPIYTSSQSGMLASNGYIEFWGRMNDGSPDVPLYYSPAYQHTRHTSLETDTAVYFLTVNATGATFHYTPTANNPGSSGLPVEPYFMYNTGTYFKTQINPGFAQVVGEYIYSSSYDIGEFWGSTNITPSSSLTDTKSNLYVYTGGPNASIRFGMVGDADDSRTVELTVNGTVVGDTVMNSFSDWLTTETVPVSLLSSNSLTVNYINNSPVTTDWIVASFYELNYPRQWNFGGQENFYFQLPARTAGYLLNITNVPLISGYTPVLYDETNGLQYAAVVNPDNSLSFALGGSTAARNLVLVNEDPGTVQSVTSLTVKNFVNFSTAANQSNYLIITNPILYTSSTPGDNPVLDYKNYRNSTAGGGFNTQYYDVNELIDQFGFGIKKHPLAIQNFLRYAMSTWPAKPQYVLFAGHSLCYNDYNTYSEQQHNPIADRLDLVPTFGYPASDNKLTVDNGTQGVPLIPNGRLSVVSGDELSIYLSKVKQYEAVQATAPNTVAGRLWMKNVLHLTGVSEPYLGQIICNYMTAYQQIIQDTLEGANVYTLCDGNATTVSQVPSGFITTLFNTGFSFLDYFGHSSDTELGYDLDNPNVYNNQGKLPVFYINGCQAGDFFVYDPLRFSTDKTFSESWTLAPNQGAVSVIGATSFSIVNYVNILLNGFNTLLTGADYAKTTGVLEKDALQSLWNAVPGDFFGRCGVEQIVIGGDPYLKLNQEALTDYDVESSTVVINPNFVAVSNNYFTVNAHFYNLGKYSTDSINVLITRTYPNNTTATIYNGKIAGFAYVDSLSLNVPIVATRDQGQNYITVTINSTNTVPEVTLQNNTVKSGVYIYQNDAAPVYPYNYAIINTNTSKLIASTENPLLPSAQYIMQIDTTTLFNSPMLVSKTLTSVGGEIEFQPGVTYRDSTVYYWQVAAVPPAGQPYKWSGFSFVYIDPAHSLTGANQSHFYQHTQSTLTGLLLDTASRRFKFQTIIDVLNCRNGVYPSAAPDADDEEVLINGNPNFIQSVCGVGTIYFCVFNPVTFNPWYNAPTGSPGRYGSKPPCGPTREYDFVYNVLDTNQRRLAMQFLDVIPNNYYVVVFNCADSSPAANTFAPAWAADTSYISPGNSMYARLKAQGFYNIDSFYYPRAFIFLYQKNNPTNFTPVSAFSQGNFDLVSLAHNYIVPDSLGVITSPQFGPASSWHEMYWSGSSLESPSTDSVILQVNGVDTLGNVSPPLYTISGVQDQPINISAINPKTYPYVQLNLKVRDTTNGSPYQLKYWRVTYDPVPEGALAPNIFLKGADTVQLGQPIEFGIAFKNVSPYTFDSMSIQMYIQDKGNVTHYITLPKRRPIASGDTLTLDYLIDSRSFSGANTIFVYFNPKTQPEQYYFNNFVYKKVYVRSDGRSPTLDVTFDNVHILNDDIVSAKPHVELKLSTPSALLLTDTSLFSVQVQYPDGSLHPYYFNTDTLRFTPATSASNNVATVEFTPAFTKQYNPSGDIYQLVVYAKDQSGNTAGASPYRIAFEVINKAMISNILNYPNPFSTSTAFVFTITGSQVPQNIKIEILTITGKVVKQITSEELGSLHVGTNITQYKWNGTDMYGNKLANGVYLYHVVTNLDGKALDKYTAPGDNTAKFFNNGYGKMYLMR